MDAISILYDFNTIYVHRVTLQVLKITLFLIYFLFLSIYGNVKVKCYLYLYTIYRLKFDLNN